METQPISTTAKAASDVSFPEVADKDPLNEVGQQNEQRQLSRSQITQQTLIEGENKAIILRDSSGNTRLFLGFKKGLF
jgi:hypothetical protein